MQNIGIALDLGTSGFRGQALDLDRGGVVLSTAVTTRHPVPGANVMDHLHFALETSLECTHDIIVHAVNRVIEGLGIDRSSVVRMAVCGNPIQLSLFQKIEFRDLAYAGKNKLQALGVVSPRRDAVVIKAREISLLDLPGEVDILIPPSVRHEIGADALAMMIRTGMLEKDEVSLATDYGTNAEMALFVNGVVYSGSAAAGPALEGQHITDGMLAIPGAIADVEYGTPDTGGGDFDILNTFVLDEEMRARPGDSVNPVTGALALKGDIEAVGVTGTGVIALLSEGIRSGLIRLPEILSPDKTIHLANGITYRKKDLLETGKAIGAIRAGHLTLCQEAGILINDIQTVYMTGAAGTYVDARKAREVGVIPRGAKMICQAGNTSLAMAREMVENEDALWEMKRVADELREHHCMFADSPVFEKAYLLELSYWTEGMSLDHYNLYSKKFKLPPLEPSDIIPEIIKTHERDIPELGEMGLTIIGEIRHRKSTCFQGCLGDEECVDECPENALLMMEERDDSFEISIDPSLCNGFACRRCEEVCPQGVFDLVRLIKG